jgi:hypothetical protein
MPGNPKQHCSIKPHEGYLCIEIRVSAVGRQQLTSWNTSRAILLGYGSQYSFFCTICTKKKAYRASRVRLRVRKFKFHNCCAHLCETWYRYCCWVLRSRNFQSPTISNTNMTDVRTSEVEVTLATQWRVVALRMVIYLWKYVYLFNFWLTVRQQNGCCLKSASSFRFDSYLVEH